MDFSGNVLGIIFALTSAFVWGSGDFSGGLASRRASSFAVLALSALSGIGILVICTLLWRETPPPMRDAKPPARIMPTGAAGSACGVLLVIRRFASIFFPLGLL